MVVNLVHRDVERQQDVEWNPDLAGLWFVSEPGIRAKVNVDDVWIGDDVHDPHPLVTGVHFSVFIVEFFQKYHL